MSESDVDTRQILTSEVDPRTERVNKHLTQVMNKKINVSGYLRLIRVGESTLGINPQESLSLILGSKSG